MTYSTEVASFARPGNEAMTIHEWHASSKQYILYCLLVMLGFCIKMSCEENELPRAKPSQDGLLMHLLI